MAYFSQFQLYQSTDIGAPVISGSVTGSFLGLMNACLVNGYGTHFGAGWTKPIQDTASVGIFKQGTGSLMTFAVIDNAAGTGGTKEARIQGWESVTSLLGGVPTGSNAFPSGSQSGLNFAGGGGYLIARLSNTITAVARPWFVFADSSSMYCFISTGDSAGTYLALAFGDIYSVKTGSVDAFKCLIIGRATENSATITVDKLDTLSALNASVTAHFAARSYTGLGLSVAVGKHGDVAKGSSGTTFGTTLLGTVTYPNSADNGIYISPVWVTEVSSVVRGQMRGFYHVCHAITNFTDGNTYSPTLGQYAGKSFLLLKQSGNAGIYLLETSNTILTN